jgi:acetylornithine/succinyldiaminopimelate/putrescine aminotransferase
VQACMDRKLLVNCTHNTVLRLLPAMNLTEQQAHDGCDILSQVIKQQTGWANRGAIFGCIPIRVSEDPCETC